MEIGLFSPPFNLPHRSPKEVLEWNLQLTVWADQLGYSEAWFGEHYTLAWEALPAPDLLIAAAFRETKNIKLGPAAHLLPYHHPVQLHQQMTWLDHASEGRYMAAFGSGGFESDVKLFATNSMEQNARMTREATEIIKGMWNADGEPYRFEGEFWSVDVPAQTDEIRIAKPYSSPHPPIAIVGASPRSKSLAYAGSQGFLPISLAHSVEWLRGHWEMYESGAAEAGLPADRSEWRVSREFFVAETDAEAWELSVNGPMGRIYRDWQIDIFSRFNVFESLDVPSDGITVEWLANQGWLIGSVETVTDLIVDLYDRTGGFGTLLGMTMDYADMPHEYQRSLELLASEVLPRVNARIGHA